VSPAGLTLAELWLMALGKAELLGMTKGSHVERVPYDPALMAQSFGG